MIKKEIEERLRARIIKHAYSRWGFSVVAAQKSDECPTFCIVYRALNKRINTGPFPTANIEEILDEMAGLVVFTKLFLLTRYYQIKLADHVQEMSTFACNYDSLNFRSCLSDSRTRR